MNRFKKRFSLAIQRFHEANAHDLGAALAYFAVFAIIPLVTVLVMITGAILSQELIRSQIFTALYGTVGPSAADFLKSSIEQGTDVGADVIASVIGGAVLIFSVITLTTQLQTSLDLIFGGQLRKMTFFQMIRSKITSFGIIFFLSILLLAFLILSAVVSVFEDYFFQYLPFSAFLIQIGSIILTYIFVFGFTVINFRFLPQTKIKWKSILAGATLTSFLFIIGKIIFTIYLYYANPGSAYGAAGALLVVLLWIYGSSQVLFLGASFSYAVERDII